MRTVQVEEIRCKTLLQRCRLDFTEWTLNPYQGCVFGCSYCYVPALRTYRKQEGAGNWGEWAQAKVNAPDVLRREMQRVDMNDRIAIGTATDAWQPAEKRYRISRAVLQELSYYPNPVHITTRSPLLIRDMDILQRMERVRVGVSIPTFDETARRIFEPSAPAIPGRVHLVNALAQAGIEVSIFWMPILHGVSDNSEAVREYLRQAAQTSARRVIAGTLRHADVLGERHSGLLAAYFGATHGASRLALTRPALAREIEQWAGFYGVDCHLY